MECSMHSIERGKQRAGFSRNMVKKMSAQAIQSGKDAFGYSSDERRYLLSKTTESSKAVVYNGYIFIFSKKNVCITMYPVPSWFDKKCRFDGKNKVRNPKKYCRVRTLFDDLDLEHCLLPSAQLLFQ